MRYCKIGGLAQDVSVVALGTGAFGAGRERREAFRLLDRYAELGGTVLDTAQVYPPSDPGAGERIIGRWLRRRGMAQQMVVSTKGGHPRIASMERSRLSADDLREDLLGSLERLGVDRIGLYWLHRDDETIPVGEIVDVVCGFQAEGLIGAYGVSNWSRERMKAARDWAEREGKAGLAASQMGWSLAEVSGPVAYAGMLYVGEAERRYHGETGLPLFAYSSQARGFFGPKGLAGLAGDEVAAKSLRGYLSEANRGRLERSVRLAEEKGCTPNQVALAYLLGQPWPVVAIAGCGSVAQVEDSCGAAEVVLPASERDWLQNGGERDGQAKKDGLGG